MILQLDKVIAQTWAGEDPFEKVVQQQGEIFREKEGRRTLRFSIGEQHFFLKLHQGVGWLEIIKNLLQLRLPVVGASNEWRAIEKLHRLNIHTMTVAGYGQKGINPATLLSFLITEELSDTLSLEDLCADWIHNPPDFTFKLAVIRQLAHITRTLHENGINHRDLYLCHFLADVSMGRENLTADNLRLHVVDLHRAQLRNKTPRRWLVKDLGGLYFSALDIGLTSRDVLRFMMIYRQLPLLQLVHERKLWERVSNRARQIYRRCFQREPVLPLE